jgi:hypothetical protein
MKYTTIFALVIFLIFLIFYFFIFFFLLDFYRFLSIFLSSLGARFESRDQIAEFRTIISGTCLIASFHYIFNVTFPLILVYSVLGF